MRSEFCCNPASIPCVLCTIREHLLRAQFVCLPWEHQPQAPGDASPAVQFCAPGLQRDLPQVWEVACPDALPAECCSLQDPSDTPPRRIPGNHSAQAGAPFQGEGAAMGLSEGHVLAGTPQQSLSAVIQSMGSLGLDIICTCLAAVLGPWLDRTLQYRTAISLYGLLSAWNCAAEVFPYGLWRQTFVQNGSPAMCYDHLATWYDATLSPLSTDTSSSAHSHTRSSIRAQRNDVHSSRQLPMT